jgi:peptidoglycan/LPS O-acetylase OafA/YrhL
MSAQASGRVASVDGLRGVLAAFVMFAHLVNAAGDGRYVGLANLCVIAFFVISGYVLTRGWRGAYAGFLVRRFVRLWPLYALCLAVGGWLSMNPAPLGNYLWFPFMGIDRQAPQDPVTWSLFVEAWAMPFMPLIIWIGRRPRLMVAAVAALILCKFWSHDLYYGAFFIIGSHLAQRTASSAFLESAPVQWLGRISYSLYLSHVLTMGALKFHAPAYWIYLAIPCCLAVAHGLCEAVERPSIYFSRRAGRFVERALGGARAAWAPA